MACPVCKKMDNGANDALDNSYDNWQRFYAKAWFPAHDDNAKHEYRYQELSNNQHTRHLELLPGNKDEQIECRLKEASIDNPPRYSAFSYTWGTAARTKTVVVDDQRFLVTNNLWAALWHLRLPDRSRILWIDAICIDQSNIEERNRVVLRMKDIYERAEEIVAWLGPEGKGGMLALKCIESVFRRYCRLVDRLGSNEAAFRDMLVHREWTGEQRGGKLRLRSGKQDDVQVASPIRAWNAVHQLLQGRTWFYRVWIVQEGTVPVRTTFYICHQTARTDALYFVFRLLKSMAPDAFPNTIVQLALNPHISALTSFAQKRLEHRQSKRDFALLDVLRMLREHTAGDPHDKVYAALGFAGSMTLPVEVDYRKRFSEMLWDVAVSCLHEKEHNLRFLGHAGLFATGHITATWIPDWLHFGALTAFPKEAYGYGSEDVKTLFDACAAKHRIWKDREYAALQPSVNGNTLKVPGVLVDYVRSTSVGAGIGDSLDTIENIWILPNMQKPYPATGEIMEEAYMRTLVADLKMKHGEVVGRGGSMYWRHRADTAPPLDHAEIQQLLQQTCGYRRFITTLQHGYIGLAPAYAEPGDAIFMLKGGEMLYLARPTLDGIYHFVGEAYVHGMMDGQAVEHFARGQGTIQTVEFAAVLDKVLDSTKQASTIPGMPFDINLSDRGYGITGVEHVHPYEKLVPYIHGDIRPKVEPMIEEAVTELMTECIQAGIGVEKVLMGLAAGPAFDKIEEAILLACEGHEEAPTGSSSRFQPAGREFARRSYIQAAIALERERTRVQVMGGLKNVALLGRKGNHVHVLDGEITEMVENGDQLAEDERIARQLQEAEFAATNSAGSPGTRNTGSTTASVASTKSKAPSRFPLLNRRTGPPVRLLASETQSPCGFSYKYRTTKEMDELVKDLKQAHDKYGERADGARTILVGKWATDPEKRPKIEVFSYGQRPRLWWEDEDGNVVDGPDVVVSMEAAEDTKGDTHIEGGDWEGEDEADVPLEFRWREDEDGNVVEGPNVVIDTLLKAAELARGVYTWQDATTEKDWEGAEEAELPSEFDLPI